MNRTSSQFVRRTLHHARLIAGFWLLMALTLMTTRATGTEGQTVLRSAPSVSAQTRELTSMSLATAAWNSATTGWQVLADRDMPIRDYSFTYGAMQIAGESFDHGLATYPFSEIVFDLDPSASRFTSRVGITDDSVDGAGSVQFSVYGDDLLLYQSDIVRAGEAARPVDVEIGGLSQLRLVVNDAGDGSLGDYALWANPTVLAGEDRDLGSVSVTAQARQAEAESQHDKLVVEDGALRERTASDKSLLDQLSVSTAAQAGFDQPSSNALIASDRVGVLIGYGGARNGQITVIDRSSNLPTFVDVSPRLTTEDGQEIVLSDLAPATPGSVDVHRFSDAAAGEGVETTLRYGKAGVGVTLSVGVFDEDAAFRLGLSASGVRLQTVEYFSPKNGSLVVGESAHYLTDRSHVYRGDIRPDGESRKAPIEATEPALVWSDTEQRGVLLSLIDYVPSPAWLTVRNDPGRRGLSAGLLINALLDDFGTDATQPPSVAIELTSGPLGQSTFARYRRVVNNRYPSAPMPESARFQWGSWYTYGPGVDAAKFLHQLDLVSSRLGDLGPWQMLLDAGWYVQYGREDAELANVDFSKFPDGIQSVADAVHTAGMDLVLYLGTGFVHDSTANGGEWLALTGLIDNHPDWLIPFETRPSEVHRYLLDYEMPAVQDYLTSIIGDFFDTHHADGILVDGLADAEGQLIPRAERDTPTGPPHPLLPTMDVYKLIHDAAAAHAPNAFIESGWLTPPAANPYAQIFFYGDESDQVDASYPFAGFIQKIDYTLFSEIALGQRSYVGAVIGDPTRSDARWWIQAAAALGTPATLEFDLEALDPQTLAAYRADLTGVNPEGGSTTYGSGLYPDTFATTRDGVTYLGIINRDRSPRNVRVEMGSLQLTDPAYTALDVATGSSQFVSGDFSVPLTAQSFKLLILRPDPGLLRTDSAVSEQTTDDDGGIITMAASGPSETPGFAQIAAPPGAQILVDGVPATRVASILPGTSAPDAGATYAQDDATGLITLAYAHRGTRTIEIRW